MSTSEKARGISFGTLVLLATVISGLMALISWLIPSTHERNTRGLAERALVRADEANQLSARANDIAASANALSAEANETSAESLDLARRSDERRWAERVDEGERPSYHRVIDGRDRAIYNRNGSEIDAVWVEDADGRAIKIFGIPPCEYYTLEAGYQTKYLYFRDPVGVSWRLDTENQKLSKDYKAMPDRDWGDAHENRPIRGCAG